MKKILTLAIIVVLSSCSGIKVTDAWKADNLNSLKGKEILVITRTDDMVSRQRFEQEIANKLRDAGKDVIQIIKNEGYSGVVLTVLKDKTKEIVTSETGGYTSGGYGAYGMGYGGYYGGFGGYYGRAYSPYGYGYGGAYVPSETRTYTSETYILETVVYNLELAKGKQLLSVISVDVTDPKSASKIAPKYADAVVKQWK